MNILVTGATGFIGRQVVENLISRGHRIRCLVRPTSATGFLQGREVEMVIGDVTDRSSVLESMEGCDWVINLANLYSFWEPHNEVFADVNIFGTRNVASCALETGVSKLVHISTAGIYGQPARLPFTEESEVGPKRHSRYFQTKYEGDLILWDLFEKKGLPLVVIYPCAVLGADDPKTTGRYIRDFVERKLPARVAEDSVFTFVHVKDVAECIVRAAEKEGNIGEKYIAGNFRFSFGQINKMISEISGVPLPKISLPDFLTLFNARFLTLVSDIIKKPPLWGMAIDQINVMIAGARADGSKAERELGIEYMPIRTALEEAIASFRDPAKR
jgi:dihydroflavonol-4-reductase